MQTVIQWLDDDAPPLPVKARPPARVLRMPPPADDADLPPGMADEIGRILGEALAAQFRADAVRNSASPSGSTYTGPDPIKARP